MNRYQKVLVCIFRSIGFLGLIYVLVTMVAASMMMPQMLKLSMVALSPWVIMCALLAFGAVPIAGLITVGIDED